MCLPAVEAFWVTSVLARETSWRSRVEVSWASSEKSSPSDRSSLPCIAPSRSGGGLLGAIRVYWGPPRRRRPVRQRRPRRRRGALDRTRRQSRGGPSRRSLLGGALQETRGKKPYRSCTPQKQPRPAPRKAPHLIHDLLHLGLPEVGGEPLYLVRRLLCVLSHLALTLVSELLGTLPEGGLDGHHPLGGVVLLVGELALGLLCGAGGEL